MGRYGHMRILTRAAFDSRLYQFLWKCVYMIKERGEGESDDAALRHRVHLQEYRANLNEIVSIGRKNGCSVVFINFDNPGLTSLTQPIKENLEKRLQELVETADERNCENNLKALFELHSWYHMNYILYAASRIKKRFESSRDFTEIEQYLKKSGSRYRNFTDIEQALMQSDGWNYEIEDYEAIMKSVAAENAIPLIDVPVLQRGYKDKKRLYVDNIHPSAAGHKLLAEALFNLIRDMEAKGI